MKPLLVLTIAALATFSSPAFASRNIAAEPNEKGGHDIIEATGGIDAPSILNLFTPETILYYRAPFDRCEWYLVDGVFHEACYNSKVRVRVLPASGKVETIVTSVVNTGDEVEVVKIVNTGDEVDILHGFIVRGIANGDLIETTKIP